MKSKQVKPKQSEELKFSLIDVVEKKDIDALEAAVSRLLTQLKGSVLEVFDELTIEITFKRRQK